MADLHDRVFRQLDEAISSQQDQRLLALTARRFVSIPGAQWEGPWGEQFDHSIKVEINKTARGHKKIVNDYLQNRVIPQFRNVGSESDEHTASTIGGMWRADNYHFKSQQARDNAFREASSGGFGAYRVTTDYADPYDKESDEMRVNPASIIPDADQSVFFDPNAVLYDKSDAHWACILLGYTKDAFEREWPDASYVDLPSLPWKPMYDWFTPEQIKVAEYYEKEDVTETLWVFTHRITNATERWWDSEIDASEAKDLVAQGYKKKGQKRKRQRVHKWILSGAEILEDCEFIAGTEIPIVPVYGTREYIDGMERFKGHVQDAMDPARAYNAQISKLIETAALSPREMPIFDQEQMPPNLAALWAEQNVKRHPYALVKSLRDENGTIIASGPIGKIEPPQLSPVIAALVQIMGNDIAELTNAEDGADEVKANTSVEAMDMAATRVDEKSAGYIDNMRQSVQREGEIYLSTTREVNFQPGRKVETMQDDETDGEETLHEPFTDEAGVYQVRNDLAKGKYKVMADVTQATSTLRDKTVRTMTTLAQVQIEAQDMEGSRASIITAIANMDGEGLEDYKEWNRKRGLEIGLFKPNDQEKRQMEQAAQGQQPSAQDQALQSVAGLNEAKAKESAANAVQKLADAHLKTAQAEAVGGPEAVPEAPTGLEHATGVVDVVDKLAGAKLKEAQARHLDQQAMHIPVDAETRRLSATKDGVA